MYGYKCVLIVVKSSVRKYPILFLVRFLREEEALKQVRWETSYQIGLIWFQIQLPPRVDSSV